jgi:hypothetical protein
LGNKVFDKRWKRWHTCSLCEQQYQGHVYTALGWACWKIYVGRPEENWNRCSAMRRLASGVFKTKRYKESLVLYESCLAHGVDAYTRMNIQANMAACSLRAREN